MRRKRLSIEVLTLWAVFGLSGIATAALAPIRADLTLVAPTPKFMATENHNALPYLHVASMPPRHALLHFDLAGLPADLVANEIEGAVLLIHVQSVSIPGNISIHPVLTPWTEAGATGEDHPAIGPRLVPLPFTITSAMADRHVAIDVTELVRTWVRTPGQNHGLALLPASNVHVQFDRRETGDGTPILDITLVGPARSKGPAGIVTIGSTRFPR